jgi:hypothetical protein
MSRSSSKKGKMWVYVAVIAIVVVIIILGVLVYELSSPSGNPSPTATPSPTPTPSISPTPTASATPTPSASPIPSPTPTGTDLTLYMASYGYGKTADSITSPGPTLLLNVGETYNMTIYNVGGSHSWEIVATKAVGTPLFGAEIGVIQSGQSSSVTFTPDQTGNFYYVCTVLGHLEFGMWGNVVVS